MGEKNTLYKQKSVTVTLPFFFFFGGGGGGGGPRVRPRGDPDSTPGDVGHCQAGGSHSASKDGHLRKVPTSCATGVAAAAAATALALLGSPSGDSELPDSPFVLNVLDGLRYTADLPVLDQRCLDSVFLGPPTRSRSQTSRDTQFQNSATYRRTLLYKHIQPLLDSRGMPMPSSSLYHSHSAQYFYPDER